MWNIVKSVAGKKVKNEDMYMLNIEGILLIITKLFQMPSVIIFCHLLQNYC